MFSKDNFIVPLNLDVILKIRNNKGVVVHIIKESTCTLKVIENTVLIKQSSEGKLISLDFGTNIEALDAHVLLRNALTQLKSNQTNNNNNNNNNNSFNSYVFNPPVDTVINVDTDYTLNFNIVQILAVYINGVLVNNINYAFLVLPNRFRWFGTAIYILETTDTVTIQYI